MACKLLYALTRASLVHAIASTASSPFRPRRDIEPRFVTPSVEGPEYEGKGWRMAPEGVAEKIDDHTIGVVVIICLFAHRFLDAHGAGFNSHPHHAHQPHHKAC